MKLFRRSTLRRPPPGSPRGAGGDRRSKEMFDYRRSTMRDSIHVQRRRAYANDTEEHESEGAGLGDIMVLDHSGHIVGPPGSAPGAAERHGPRALPPVRAPVIVATEEEEEDDDDDDDAGESSDVSGAIVVAEGEEADDDAGPGDVVGSDPPALHRPSESSLRDPACPSRAPSAVIESRRSRVTFGTVTVRDYGVVLGDHPDTSYGPPVALGWDYLEYKSLDVDDYEIHHALRRPLKLLILNYYRRKELLAMAGHTEKELKEATREKDRTRFRRSVTRSTLPVRRVEDAVESAGRKLKRLVSKDREDKFLYSKGKDDATDLTDITCKLELEQCQ